MRRALLSIVCFFATTSVAQADTTDESTTPMSDVAHAKWMLGVSRVIGAGVDTAAQHAPCSPCEPPTEGLASARTPWDFEVPAERLAIRAPRLGFDVVLGGLTLGASPLLWHTKTTRGIYLGSTDVDAWFYGGAVRGGVLAHVARDVALWGRASLLLSRADATEHTMQSNRGGGPPLNVEQSVSYTSWSLALEPTLVMTVSRSFALTFAIDVDIPIQGTRSTHAGSSEYAAWGAGLSLGALVFR